MVQEESGRLVSTTITFGNVRLATVLLATPPTSPTSPLLPLPKHKPPGPSPLILRPTWAATDSAAQSSTSSPSWWPSSSTSSCSSLFSTRSTTCYWPRTGAARVRWETRITWWQEPQSSCREEVEFQGNVCGFVYLFVLWNRMEWKSISYEIEFKAEVGEFSSCQFLCFYFSFKHIMLINSLLSCLIKCSLLWSIMMLHNNYAYDALFTLKFC